MAVRPARGAFRPDIEGLRALAIGAVLLDHAEVPGTAGGFVGVDVFFVISGFLITRALVAELERRDRIAFAVFYARRVKRLLPSALVVLAAVVVASALLISPVRADAIAGDVAAAGTYRMNLHLASQAIDYFGGGARSPLQHFWSLAVEEQFYLAWPALLLAAWWAGRRHGRRALWVVLGVAAASSFAYACVDVANTPTTAYFSTRARVWELAAGGLLALALGGSRTLPRAAALPLAWAGLAAVLYAVLGFDHETRVPGAPTLVPVLGAVALIAAGTVAGPRPGLLRALFEHPAAQWVGRRSYVWYLWHWPVLVVGTEVAGGSIEWPVAVALTALSVVPTVLTHRYVEEPLRRSRAHAVAPWRTVAFAPAGAAIAVALGALLVLALPSPPTLASGDVDGANRLDRSRRVQTSARALRPAPRDAAADRSRIYRDGCLIKPLDTRVRRCTYGATRSHTTVVLFGDSHAMQYFPALERIAKARRWRLVVRTKAGCTPAQATVINTQLGRVYDECDTWRERVLDGIERHHPDMVIAAGATKYDVVEGETRLSGGDAKAALTAGYTPTLERLTAASPVVRLIREAPKPPQNIPSCVARELEHLTRCAFPRRGNMDDPAVEPLAAARVPGVEAIDLTSRFCTHGLCPAVIGNAIVYRDGGHITATYSRTLTAYLARRLPADF
jgi:peptidoglycan/LPS O-acetylase OafA/YrhL